jgi:hypothetical protein
VCIGKPRNTLFDVVNQSLHEKCCTGVREADYVYYCEGCKYQECDMCYDEKLPDTVRPFGSVYLSIYLCVQMYICAVWRWFARILDSACVPVRGLCGFDARGRRVPQTRWIPQRRRYCLAFFHVAECKPPSHALVVRLCRCVMAGRRVVLQAVPEAERAREGAAGRGKAGEGAWPLDPLSF